MKKIVKIVAITLASIIGAAVLTVGGYVGYVAGQYYRIEDKFALNVVKGADNKVKTGESYTLVSYNVGFGSYSPEYSFFMDEGEMKDGTKTVGIYGKGMNKADVQKNVNGQVKTLKELSADFMFLQEVDETADRSYGINMYDAFVGTFNYNAVFASNFHTANLFYPLNDPIGVINSGILTLSKYNINSAVRRSFPVTDAFPDKFFDLDRCFSISTLDVEGSTKQLKLINLHMSAYDEGGLIRAQQLKMLNEIMKEERDAGNYVVIGGDFNHCLIADQFASDEQALSYFKSEQKVPDWVKNSVLHNKELAEGYSIAASINASTCRGADIPYEKDVCYATVIDGFIVSDNVEVVAECTIDTDYAYSDHNPVQLTFKLK